MRLVVLICAVPEIPISGALSVLDPGAAGQGSALTPAHAELRRMGLDAVVSPHTRRNYGKALDWSLDRNVA
jgi:hypothetical protein